MGDGYVIAFAFLFGLIVGSFLNVLIYRLPLNQNVITGRSRCPHCKETVRWFDNIPVVSYLFLRGRCRSCGEKISIAYPVVELLSGVITGLVVYYYGVGLLALWLVMFFDIMLVITLIDWKHRIIPDELSIGGVVLGWIGALVCLDVSLLDSFIGSLVGGGLLFLIAFLYRAVRKIEGMGGGDIKLMAMIGAFLGWKMVFPVLFVASLLGSIYGLFLMSRGGNNKTAVAFGSFLAPSASLVFVFGARLWALYRGL